MPFARSRRPIARLAKYRAPSALAAMGERSAAAGVIVVAGEARPRNLGGVFSTRRALVKPLAFGGDVKRRGGKLAIRRNRGSGDESRGALAIISTRRRRGAEARREPRVFAQGRAASRPEGAWRIALLFT